AVGAADVADLDAARRVDGEGAAHGDGLVVGVGVDGHEAHAVQPRRDHSGVTLTVRITSPRRIEVTTSIPLVTWPKRLYCLPSLWRQSTVVMKNCEPLVLGPELAMARAPATYSPWTGSSLKL